MNNSDRLINRCEGNVRQVCLLFRLHDTECQAIFVLLKIQFKWLPVIYVTLKFVTEKEEAGLSLLREQREFNLKV